MTLRAPDLATVERWLDRLYVAAEGATLRAEDRRKASMVTALLAEAARALPAATPPVVVDAAAGKAYAGLLLAQLVLHDRGGRIVLVEREAARAAASQRAAARLEAPAVTIETRRALVEDPAAWPDEPDLVMALHACGPASDHVIDRAVAARARRILLVPCCYGAAVPGEAPARRAAETLGIPRHAAVRRRFAQAIVDAQRTLRLEAAGWQTEVVELVPPTISPHNLLWRARRVGEPGRAADSSARLARLQGCERPPS